MEKIEVDVMPLLAITTAALHGFMGVRNGANVLSPSHARIA